RRIDIEQARSAKRAASNVPEGPLGGQHKSSRIEESIGCSQNHRPLEIRIPVRYVGVTGVASSGNIGAGQRCEGEPARNPGTGVRLPAADQLVYNASRAASEVLPIPERQLIAGKRVELVGKAIGSDTAVHPAIIGAIEVRWLVSGGRSKDRGIHIHDF